MPALTGSANRGLRQDSVSGARKRLSRAEKKAQTRARLLDAAARVFARRGYQGASVDEVAEEAGYSKGAVYSNFDGKEDLFLELYAHQADEDMRGLEAVLDADCSAQERVQRAARWFLGFVEAERDFVLLFFEGWAAAARDPKLRAEFAARRERMQETLARILEQQAHALGVELPVSAEQAAIAVLAIGNGFIVEKLANPDAVVDELYGQVLSAFLGLALTPNDD